MSEGTMRVLLNLGPFGFPWDGAQEQQLKEACPRAQAIVKNDKASLADYDGRAVQVLFTEEVPANLAAWPQLRFVQSMASGIDYIYDHPIWKTDIVVCNASGTHSVPIAQYITCALLMLVHRMPEITRFKATRQWPERNALAGFVVRGMTAGIVGYGSIGREAARQLSALGLRIVCMKRDPSRHEDEGFNPWPGSGDPRGEIPEGWYGPDQLSEMLPKCDFLIVTAPNTPRAMGMIGPAEIALLRPGAHVIVASRGGIVQESALAAALREGHLAGAVVDSYAQEPLPRDHPFFATPNLTLTAHMSGVYQPYWPHGFKLFCENLGRFSRSEAVLNRASGELGY